jgi:hypothetical protein
MWFFFNKLPNPWQLHVSFDTSLRVHCHLFPAEQMVNVVLHVQHVILHKKLKRDAFAGTNKAWS